MSATIIQFPLSAPSTMAEDPEPHIRLWIDEHACGFGGIVVQAFGVPILDGRKQEFLLDEHEDAAILANEWAIEVGRSAGRRCNIIDMVGAHPWGGAA